MAPASSSARPAPARTRGQLDVLRPDHQRGVQMLVDRVERRGVLGRVVRAAGQVGDPLEGLGVELGVDLEPVEVERGAARAADADRVDPHAPVGGGLGRHHRVRPLVVLAVGQQHDDRGQVRAGRDRRGRRASAPVTGCCSSRRWGRRPPPRSPSATPRCHARARSRAAASGGRSRRARWPGSLVGCWTAMPGIAEGDDADHDARRLALDEVGCGRDRGGHAGRLEVGGGHAARDVEREDDRALAGAERRSGPAAGPAR